jgi:uncharacterized protein
MANYLFKAFLSLFFQQKRIFVCLLIISFSLGSFAQQPIELNNWKFITGDNFEWAMPGYNDSSWKFIKTGMSWETQEYKGYDGYAWYRIRFFLPSSLKESTLYKDSIRIALGKIDDCDQTYLNGKLLGENAKLMTGNESATNDMSKLVSANNINRKYFIASNDPRLNWDRENVIAVRVYDNGGNGGMCSGLVALGDLSDCINVGFPVGLLKVDSDGKIRITITLKNKLPKSELKGRFSVKAENGFNPNAVSTQSFDVDLKGSPVQVNFCFHGDKSKWIKATFTFTESKTGKTVSFVRSNIIMNNDSYPRNFDSLWNSKLQTRLKSSDPSAWHPVLFKADVPVTGVALSDSGLFKIVMERNINYLLHSFTVNHMLYPFLMRAGKPVLPDDRPQIGFWDTDLRGSNAGRFMMGAGNTLRWIENVPLRDSLNKLIDGIEACREPNGYILPYPHVIDSLRNEEPGYARAWLTHGLIEAGISGNGKAWSLLRGNADYFNHWDELLPKLIYWWYNGHQGHIASTRTYFTKIGKPEDLLVAEKYYVCDWWMDQLKVRDVKAIWQYPLSCPHNYLLTGIEPFLDHYRATGDKRYLDAALGAWDLYHDNWEHVGGSTAICESQFYPPKSYYLTSKDHTGETCGSSFWIKLNQRLHQLYPDQEKYMNEIEKSIYNVILACQMNDGKICYHNYMEGKKNVPVRCDNTCCEGQGTRILGSLPEYIFSTAPDGLYVNLYEPSSISWKIDGAPVKVSMESKFPFNPHVVIKLATSKPMKIKLRVRIPAWASNVMAVNVNRKQFVTGKPSSYAVLDRTWANGDEISFDLPMDFRISRYVGADTITGHERYAIEYGPILLAAVGKQLPVSIKHDPKQLKEWLIRKSRQTLDFTIRGDDNILFVPYFRINEAQTFTTYPVIGQ